MRRVLVTGTSHAAAIRRALPQIAVAFPGHQVTCWTLTARCFQDARVNDKGVLTPDPSLPGVARQALRWNGADSVDLTRFDHILICGAETGFDQCLHLLQSLQPLEWGARAGARGVSLDFLRAALRSTIEAALDRVHSRIPFDNRFASVAVPFPTRESHEQSAKAPRPTAEEAHLPKAQALFALYEAELAAAHQARGLTFVAQPRDTLAAPWVTQGQFIDTSVADCLHMNATYGLHLYRTFAACLSDTEITAPLLAGAAGT